MLKIGGRLMRCPYCNQYMYEGNIEANGQRIIWSNQSHHLSMKTTGLEITLAKTTFRNTKIAASMCKNCKKIIIDFAALDK